MSGMLRYLSAVIPVIAGMVLLCLVATEEIPAWVAVATTPALCLSGWFVGFMAGIEFPEEEDKPPADHYAYTASHRKASI